MMQRPVAIGSHYLADFEGVDPGLLMDCARIEALMKAAALAAQATIIGCTMHHFGEGQGVTGVVLLAESHLSIHTWPEFGFAAIDIFTCQGACPEKAVAYLLDAMQPHRHHTREEQRGVFTPRPYGGLS